MIDPFILRSFLVALGIVLMTAPMGCFVIWRRLSFVGDTLAHASLLGVALGVILKLPLMLAVILFCALVALLLFAIIEDTRMSTDSSLSVISYGALGLGMVLFSKLPGPALDPSHILFGDILFVQLQDLLLIGLALFITALFLLWRGRSLILWIMSPELAHALRIPIKRLRLEFILVLAIIIALALKVAGVLLAPALMIVPAAAAALWAKSPLSMVKGSIVIALGMVIFGFLGAFAWDLPAGPAIVAVGALLFGVILGIKKWRE